MAGEAVGRSEALFERARRVVPGGVNSPVRAFGAVGGTPRFIARGEGAYLVDEDGRRYVDLVCSWGPLVLGHAHPEVIAAVRAAAERGLGYGAPTAAEVELAEQVRERVPPAQRVRLVTSGTEATMTALRLARAFTGRTKVVKFAGCYHGHVDALLAAGGSGLATFGVPGTPGVSPATAAETIVLPYNDVALVEAAFAQHGDEIACVITEAAAANMGVVAPLDGFNAALRRITAAHGALLVLDEVLTGFRVSRSGWFGLERVEPDLFTFGKVLGGGLPLAAFAGRAEVMDLLAPAGPVYQAGTLAGNPLSVAAGLATLRACTPQVYAHLDDLAAGLSVSVAEALDAAGVPHHVGRAGNLFSVFFGPGPVVDFAGAQRQSTSAYAAFFHAMLERGVALPPSAFEAWFVSAALDDEAVERVVAALPAAAAAAARAAA